MAMIAADELRRLPRAALGENPRMSTTSARRSSITSPTDEAACASGTGGATGFRPRKRNLPIMFILGQCRFAQRFGAAVRRVAVALQLLGEDFGLIFTLPDAITRGAR